MRRRIIFAVFALMLLGVSLSGCRSQELCPAYTNSEVVSEQSTENLS